MKRRVIGAGARLAALSAASLAACVAAVSTSAWAPSWADEGDPRGAYVETVECAGRFKWLLDASSGGQPPINDYSLDQRVKAATTLEAQARSLAPNAGFPAAAVPAAILDVADATTALFLDDPDKVTAMLARCAPMAGVKGLG